jgi:serine/threonine protein kinase
MFLPTPGALVANRFRLRHAIGTGGMGQVWEAHDQELDGPCAVKFIVDHLARDPEARLRMLREARAVARLRSPHVVNILSVGEHADAMYLAMELLEGETLAKRLERAGKLDALTTLALLEQVMQVLDKAHPSGIVHRDLKPDNIWLAAEPRLFVKVLDFGIVKSTLRVGGGQTASGALMGTPQYMSPEQANGEREVDHRSDLWSLAIIAMECLSGRRPFESTGLGNLLLKIMTLAPPPVHDLDPTLPATLEPWWQRALARDPDQRFQTAAELVQGLRQRLTTLAPGRSQSVFDTTERGSWLEAAGGPPPVRVHTLVTSLIPTPLPQPPARVAAPFEPVAAPFEGVAAPFEREARVAPAAGPSVGPVTHTTELSLPRRGRSWWYAAGSGVLAVALFGAWRVAQHPRDESSSAEGVNIHWGTLRPVAVPSELAPGETPRHPEVLRHEPPSARELPVRPDAPSAREPPPRDVAPTQQGTPAEPAVPPEALPKQAAPQALREQALREQALREQALREPAAGDLARAAGTALPRPRSSNKARRAAAPAQARIPLRLTAAPPSGSPAKPAPTTASPPPGPVPSSKGPATDNQLRERLGF